MVSWWCVIGEVHGGQGDVTICNQHMPMGYQQARSAAVEKGGIAHWIFMWVPRYFLHFRWTSCLGGLDSACIGFKASPRRMIMDTVDGCKILHHQKDGSTPINNGINHLSTGAGFRSHPPYVLGDMPWNQLPPSERRRLMSSWWRSWSSWAAGHAMQPAHPKKNKPSGGFCWGRFCWVYVEFMLSLCWVYFGLLLDDFQTLGNRSNLQTWAIMDFPLDFSGISHWFPQRDHHQPQEARRAVPYRRPGVVDWARRCRNTQTSLGLVATTDSWTARGMQWE